MFSALFFKLLHIIVATVIIAIAFMVISVIVSFVFIFVRSIYETIVNGKKGK